MAWFALVLAAAGAGVSAYSSYRQGQAAEDVGTHQQQASESVAQVSDYNASIAALQAQDALARGAEEESRFRTQIRGAIGTQRANIAAGNIDVSFGSAVDVQADAAFLGELDALQIRTNAAREAWGFDVQAEDYRMRASVSRREGVYLEAAGRQAAQGAYLSTASSLLGSASSLLQMRYGFSHTATR